MPKEQLNTPVRLEVTELLEELPYEGTSTSWVQRVLEEDDVVEPNGRNHIEETPVVFLRWNKGSNPSGTPDSSFVGIELVISEEAILRSAKQIMDRRKQSEDWTEREQHVWWSKECTFTTSALSRSEINNFIKSLRRARDAVFGADE